ncbi:MAG: dynamin family protein [Synergistaceae bacterium]|nr:dynamin family protein [Synergistaceae bacterium]
MIRLNDWERDNFINTPHLPDITVIFPSREIYFSPELLNVMRLNIDTCPKTLDQWYELCHPEDHMKLAKLEAAIYGHESTITFTRKLYCGDGYYRNFRLDALIQRDNSGRPLKLSGSETLALSAWLAAAQEGDRIECTESNGRAKILEAVRVQGVMTLRDIGWIEDMEQENLRLRREIQRRIFTKSAEIPVLHEDFSVATILRNRLEDCIKSALNVLTGDNRLKALRRSLNETCLTIGIAGLTSSGKSSFVNALLGERLIPEQTRATTNIPIICREGESRSARIMYQDGRTEDIRGARLTGSYMKDVASESHNPGNKSGISRIEITMPGAMIPEGICFVDTPGFDALASSGGAALRNVLPELDMIIYVTPVRARLKGADYDYLRVLTTMNDRLVFVLSQIDLERDDSEAGRVINSAHDKILGDINAIRQDMRNFSPNGHDYDVIPVSSKTALENFYDKKSQAWADSNIEDAVRYFAPLGYESYTRALLLRAERTLRLVDGVVSRKEVTGSSRWRLQEVAGKLRKILADRENLPEMPSGYAFAESVITPKNQNRNILSSLITSMKEREFRTRFFALDAFKGKSKALLLGAERNQSLKLFSRLAHNLMLEALPDGGVTSGEWLCTGHVSPFGCIMIPVTGSGDNILIAPSNANISQNIDWHKLFREYVPVVSVDLARVDSGLSDLVNSPYITGLALTDWVLSFGNAGLFDTRQIDLVSQVPKRVREFVELNGLKSPEWFIYENYKIF